MEKGWDEVLKQFLALLVWFSLKFYPVLPERIPTHFGLDGSPDGWGSKHFFLILTAIGLAVFGLLHWLIRRPHIFNFPVKITTENVERQYSMAVRLLRCLKTLVAWLFAYIVWGMGSTALGAANGLSGWLAPVLLTATLGTVFFYNFKTTK